MCCGESGGAWICVLTGAVLGWGVTFGCQLGLLAVKLLACNQGTRLCLAMYDQELGRV